MSAFRFEIYNEHVNVGTIVDPSPLPQSPNHPIVANALGNFLNGTNTKPTAAETAAAKKFLATIKPNLTIDVTFDPREVLPSADPKINLVKPGPQNATVTFGGFKPLSKLKNHGVFKTLNSDKTGGPILTTVSTQAAVANPQTINTLDAGDSGQIKFFAGEAADPFFFDLTAFSNFIKSCHDGAPNPACSVGRAIHSRGIIYSQSPSNFRFRWCKARTGRSSARISSRNAIRSNMSRRTEPSGSADIRPWTASGNPAVNVALIPFNDKDRYNGGTPRSDAQLSFAGDILTTVQDLGLGTLSHADAINTLVYLEFDYGDILKFVPGGPAGYPNGRRLADDTITTILTVLAGGAVSDNVTQTVPPQTVFPYVALPYQPQAHGAVIGDDHTEN